MPTNQEKLDSNSILFQFFSENDKPKIEEYMDSVPEGDIPLWQYWEEFADSFSAEGGSIHTLKSVRATLQFYVRHLNLRSIEQCNSPRKLYFTLLEAKKKFGWASSTMNDYRKRLNTYFRWLESVEYIDENRIKKVRKLKEKRKEQYTLNTEQVKKLRLSVVNRHQNRLMTWRDLLFIDLLIFTGARVCELLQLEINDIVKEDGKYKLLIRGRKQKGRPRYYSLPPSIRDIYEMYLKVREDLGRDEVYLFISQSKRTGWTYKGLRGLFRRLKPDVGFTVTAIALRRHTATSLSNKGMPLEKIADYLGHTRTSTTKLYIARSCCLTEDCAAEMAKILDN